MSSSERAAENLQVIRSLMERATVYRAMSAETALVGGLLSVGAGLWSLFAGPLDWGLHEKEFFALWGAVLFLTGMANSFFIWRDSRRHGGALFSAKLRMAAGSVLPAFLCAGGFTGLFFGHVAPVVCAWILFYGLALLATQSFSPLSLVILGWVFLLTGLVTLFQICAGGWGNIVPQTGSFLMTCSFGGYHLVYAAVVWLMGRKSDASSS